MTALKLSRIVPQSLRSARLRPGLARRTNRPARTRIIETRRHWFTGRVPHDTEGTVNVLNLVQGEEVTVESPEGKFDPFVVHYAETFIVPAAVGKYTIRPPGPAAGTECATLKPSSATISKLTRKFRPSRCN